jgi:serine/threonine protein kinase
MQTLCGARSTRSFHHPNIIRLLGFSMPLDRAAAQGSDTLCLLYEYAVRGSVDKMLKDDCSARLLPWQLRLRIMLQIATALNYMHKRSASPAYHRDVKSANVVINDDFVAKLIDCGLSKYVPEQGADAGFHSVAPSMPNMRFGTMQYGTKPRSHPKMATWWHQNIYFGPQNASQSLQSLENIRFPHHRDKSHDQKSFLQKLDTALYMLLRSGC